MGTKKSQTSETQATSTASTTAPQATPVTPSSNRTRGRNTVAQSTTTKSADKAAGAPISQTENQQSQFAVPDRVRRSGRKTTLPKNLIHDSVIETPTNRNRRESAASESSRRRNSSASSNKSSRKKQPAEKKPAEPPKSNIKLEGQILTSSDEEFPKTHKKGSLYGWRRLPPMTPPTPGRKTWETDSDKEERRGTRGNLGWGPVQEKQKIASEVEDSQEEGDTGSVSPPGQDEATELGNAEAKATAPAPLVIESDDTDRDYDAELSELESSPPVSTKPRTTSEIPDRQGKEDVEDLQEQRPPKRRKLVLDDEAKGEEGLKSAEPATSGPTTSKPKKIWVPEDDDMDFIGQDFTKNGVDDPHMDEEIQAKADLQAGVITMGDGAAGKEVAAQEGRISENPIVPPAETNAQEEDRMEVDAEETEETAIVTDERSEVEQRVPNAVEQSSKVQTLDENPSTSQDIIMMDNKQPLEVPDVVDMKYEATNERETESPLPAPQQEVVAAPEGAPETIEEDVLHTQEEVNPQIESIWISSSESETSKNLQPIDDVTDEEDLPRPGCGMDAEPVRGDVSETEFVVEEETGGEVGIAATPDEIMTPGGAVKPHVTETVPVIVESSGVGNGEGDWMETERVKDYEVETIDGEDTNMYHEEYPNDDAEMEEEQVEASGDGEEMGIIGIMEQEEAAKGDYAEDQVTMEPGEVAAAFVPVLAPLSESRAEEADEVQDATNDVSEIHEAAIQPPRDTTSKESERESTPALASSQIPSVTVEEVGIGTSLIATEEPMAPEVSPQDMDVDEDQGDQQGQDNASSSSIGDHMEDTGVEKFRELSLGVNWAEESETEIVQKENPEVNRETYSKMEEVSKDTGPIQAEVEGVVTEIEVTVSRTKAEVGEKYTVESRPEEAVKDSSYSVAESVVETKTKVDVAPASDQAPSEPEAPQPKGSDDESMEDVEKVVEDTPTMGGKDYHMQEAKDATGEEEEEKEKGGGKKEEEEEEEEEEKKAMEQEGEEDALEEEATEEDEEEEEEAVEKASEAAQEGQVGINGETSEDKTATGSQATENTTTVTAQQEQEHKSMEQETEEREKESVAEEPGLPYRPLDDLGAENDTIDDDDHITIYSSSSGLPSDDELGPGGLTMAITKRSWRKRRCRRSKGDKESVTGVIGDQRDQPQLDELAFDVPSWNVEDDTVESSVPTAEPQSVTQIDEPDIEPGEPIKDLEMDDQEEQPQQFRPESLELEDEDNDDTLEPEINEDVGLPPDFDVSGSERSAEAYDGDRESSPDAHLFSGGGLMDLLRAVEFVENTSSPPLPLQPRKEVLPSRTFKMYGDVWERLGSDVIPKLPHRPEIPQPFPDNIVNLADWEGIQFTKCPVCSELLGDVIVNAMDSSQTTQNTIAEHIENCGKQKGSLEGLKSKARDSKGRTSTTPLPVRTGEGVRRINLRVKLSDGTYFQNPSQAPSAIAAPAPVDNVSVNPAQRPPPTLNGIAAQLPKNAAEYAQALREIEELLPNTRDIFKHLTGEREIHSDSEDSLPDAYEYDPEGYEDGQHPLTDEAYFMKITPISVFQSRSQESFKRSYDHAFAEQENIIAVMAQLQAEFLELEEEIAAREHRMPKRLRPLDSRVVFEDKKEADLYNYKYDPDPKKRGRQDPDAQRTDSVYVGGRELRGRARNRESVAAEFLQGRKKRGPAPASQIPRPAGTRGPGRPRKEVPVGTDSGVTSVQPSRDASIDAAVTPQVSPAKRGGKIIRNPRGYNGRNKPVVSLPPTREPSLTPVVQAAPAVLPRRRRGRKSNAEKAREAEAAAAAAAAKETVKEIAPIQTKPVVPVVQVTRRTSGRGRPPKVQPVAVEVNDTITSQSARTTPSGSASEHQLPSLIAIKPAAPKPDTAIPKPQVAKSVGKRREILKIRMSSGGSQKVEQILSPTTASPKLGEEKATESSGDMQTEEFQESSQVDLNEEKLELSLIGTGPTAPESFYGPATPKAAASDEAALNATAAPTPSTIPPPPVRPPGPQPPIQFIPTRVVPTPTSASSVTGTSPGGVIARQFFGNASRRARRGEFINSGVNNDSTPYKTYASGKVVGNAPIQVQTHDRALSPEEPCASVPLQPATNVQLDFVMDMTVPQQLIPSPTPAPAPVTVLPPAPPPQATCQLATAPAAPPAVSIAIMQPVQHNVATPKPRGRGGKSSSGAKGAGQSTFLPTITPDNWKLKKGVKQTVKTESGSGPSPREGSVFRDMSGRATPTTSVGSTPITPNAPSFQGAEMTGQSQSREIEWIGTSMQTPPPPPAPIIHMPSMTMPPISNPPMQTPSIPVSIAGGYIHHLPPASHHNAAPTLTPYIKPSVDSPVPPYGGHEFRPIQPLSFVNAHPGEPKPKVTRGKTYKKPTMGMDFPKPTKEDEFRALTGGQMELGKRKRKGKGTGEGLGDVMEGPLAPVPGGYPGQGVIGVGRVGLLPASPKRARFDTHIGISSPQSLHGYSQAFEGDMDMFQAPLQQLLPPIPPYYPPPLPQHANQLMPMHYYSSGPSQELPSQAPTVPMGSQPRSRPTTSSASEQTETLEQLERGETPRSLRSDSEEKVPGEGCFQINMWRPPIPGTIGA